MTQATAATAGRLESFLSDQHDAGRFNGVVLLAEGGDVLLRRAFGVKDVETGARLTPDTAFEIGSISKPFTATAILQLAERAEYTLTETLTRYFPTLPYFEVTIGDMLSHTSGLFDVCCQPALRARFDAFYGRSDPPYSNADYVAFIEQEQPELLSKPGTEHRYSNTAYLLLALIVERESEMAFDDYLAQHVLSRAGLDRTYVYSLMDDRTIPDRAVGYRREADGELVVDVPVATPERPSVFGLTYGDDEVFSTVDDLLAFGRALAAGRLLRPDTLRIAYMPARLLDGSPARYGLGWRVTTQPDGTTVVDHTGSTHGFLASCTFPSEGSDTTLALLTNVVSDAHAEVREAAYRMLWGG